MNEFLELLDKIHGPARRFDPLGRITVPKEIRNKLEITTETNIEMLEVNGYIILKPIKNE